MAKRILPQDEQEVNCADELCGEDVFRDGPLCLDHFIEVETATWDDWDAERHTALEATGYIFDDLVEVPA